jgi:hypothetical protein
MRRALLILAACCFSFACFAEGDPVVPPGIRYKRASAELNNKAREKLTKVFSADATDKDVLSLFEDSLICGPCLCREIKKDPDLAKRGAPTTFEVPVLGSDGKVKRTDKLEGRLLQSSETLLAFWKYLSRKTDFSKLVIRKLNPAELKFLWAMYPFDLQEPLFILESKERKILVLFTSPEDLRILWIDDYQEMRLYEKTP